MLRSLRCSSVSSAPSTLYNQCMHIERVVVTSLIIALAESVIQRTHGLHRHAIRPPSGQKSKPGLRELARS
eukprot:2789421-Pleurochrysis_carterae.AAC.3